MATLSCTGYFLHMPCEAGVQFVVENADGRGITLELEGYGAKQRLVDQYLSSSKPRQKQEATAQLEDLRGKRDAAAQVCGCLDARRTCSTQSKETHTQSASDEEHVVSLTLLDRVYKGV